MTPITAFLVFLCIAVALALGDPTIPLPGLAALAAAALIASSSKMANAWQTFVILRMGRLPSVEGAGLFVICPARDRIVAIVDCRIPTTHGGDGRRIDRGACAPASASRG